MTWWGFRSGSDGGLATTVASCSRIHVDARPSSAVERVAGSMQSSESSSCVALRLQRTWSPEAPSQLSKSAEMDCPVDCASAARAKRGSASASATVKGILPESIANILTPADQKSTGGPSYPSTPHEMISGAHHGLVPHLSYSRPGALPQRHSSSDSTAACPKSQSTARSCASSRMFSSFTSRCTTRRRWQCASARSKPRM
mmetsp:Transcript_26903/g.86918  ORF Transcript_26903/g.86918 Transcript_26903/m.86918 type:complete len:201 (+) Transcript_26903:561-1163(+)